MKKVLIFLTVMLLIVTGCNSKKENQVIIYSCMEEERNQELIKQIDKEFPNLDVVVQYMPTGNLAAKLKSEGSKIEADIIIDLETAHMENLKDNFASLDNYDDSHFIEGINPIDKKYFIWGKTYASLIIDNDYFKEHKFKVPETYEDLLNDNFKGLIAMPDPKTSGTGYSYYLNVINIYGQDKALEYFDKLSKNILQFTTSGSGPINLLKQGEIAIAMGMVFQGVEAINNDANYSIIELDTGVPYNTTSFGILNGSESNKNVGDVFKWISTEFVRYDKDNFVPGNVLKKSDVKIPNYPNNIIDADMSNISSISTKDSIIQKWVY